MAKHPAEGLRYLTPKRAEFLRFFTRYEHIATSDAYRLLDARNETQRRAVRRFLTKLFEAGYLQRTLLVDHKHVGPFPSWELSYRLSDRGAEVAGGHASDQSPYSLPHDQEVERFVMQLATWRGKTYIFPRPYRRTVNPDKPFGLERDGSWYYFFLEVERGRQNLSKTNEKGIAARLAAYETYRRSDRCAADWKLFRDFRVLLAVSSEELRANLLARLEGALAVRWIWITVADHWHEDLLGKIWKTPRDQRSHCYSLLDIWNKNSGDRADV
jgi:hypothetical protein